MTKARTDGLLLDLLNHQVDDGDVRQLSDARIEQALTTGPGFSELESRLLWRSPLARDTLFHIRERLRQDVLDRWQAAAIEPVARLKAAADGADDVIRLEGEGFTLTIIPEADETMPWILSLKIDTAFRQGMPAGLRFQLVDSGGKVWLTGWPNSRGEINDGWYDTEQSPKARLLDYDLRLAPI